MSHHQKRLIMKKFLFLFLALQTLLPQSYLHAGKFRKNMKKVATHHHERAPAPTNSQQQSRNTEVIQPRRMPTTFACCLLTLLLLPPTIWAGAEIGNMTRTR